MFNEKMPIKKNIKGRVDSNSNAEAISLPAPL